jgi:hypothetical protein
MSNFLYFERHKKIYKNFKPCFCPIIQEFVYFNADGIHHLLYKNRRLRSLRERYYRLGLIKYINPTIKNSKKLKIDIISIEKYFILENIVENKKYGKQKIKVVLIKRGNGKIYFLSVMRVKLR